ncbi:MAG: hydantoinase B/oxoprolinase family protein [Alphaproteobacteria bacterium]|nr:hydantoinase B/oxoprolinase family protein [Alphaproteobacteria bacterium]
MALTPIDVELLRNGLSSICDEMFLAIMKSAYSTNIKERHDHSAAIFDAKGRVVVQGESLPLHLASMLGLVEVVLERYGVEKMRPGDMFVSNDPFVGRGSHLPDVAILAPVFRDGKVVLFVSNIAHHSDVGGMAPGSMAGGMTEIYQEGVRIPPIRIVQEGVINDEVFQLILLNVRVPHERRGDYLSQVAGNRLGTRRLHELFRRWSASDLEAGCEEIIRSVARRMRAGIRDIPDGVYRFTDYLDDDGMGTTDIPIKVEIRVRGDEVWLDFAGTGPQVRGNMNNSFAGLQAAVLFALKVLIDPEGPTNHGMLDPVHIKAPLGSVVNAVFPAATAARAQTCQRIIDAILGALAKALPDRVIAASNGANGVATLSGTGPDGRYYLYMETIGGGAGARSYKDGTDGVQVHVTNTSNLPIEALENEYPLLIERYELIEDSGGAGRFRGGMGLRRVYRALGHTVTFSGQGERCVHQPYGLFGGAPGRTGRLAIVHDDGKVDRLANKPASLEVPPDAVVLIETPGAGGYGKPATRAPDKRAEDAAGGKFSAKFMRKHYGTAKPARGKPRRLPSGSGR